MASSSFKGYLYKSLPIETSDSLDSELSQRTSVINEFCRVKSRAFFFFLTFTIFIFYMVFSVMLPESTNDIYYIFGRDDQGPSVGLALACRIPRLDPEDSTIRHLIQEPDPEDCTKEYPELFQSTLEGELVPTQILQKNETLGIISCCYKSLSRGNKADDNNYEISKKCKSLSLSNTSKVDIQEDEFVAIYCKKEEDSSNSTTKKPEDEKLMDMHAFAPLKPKTEKRIKDYYEKIDKNSNSTALKEKERLNVVILGIDGTSHMNFLRTMPKSYAYLMEELDAIEMHGVNKVGDNTYPNIAALLSFKNVSELDSTCVKDKAFDACPFIWKDFAENGFRTFYGEDSPWMGIFNYIKKGFKHPPTDYYLRPFSQAAENLMGTHKKLNAKLCYGPRFSFTVLLDYMKKLAYTMGHDKRYFQFLWATSLTHDYLNEGRLGDADLLSTLKWFKDGGYFNDTAFILMSDHGIRWGDIRTFLQGHLEERLPFLYFVYPDWFKKKYSRAYENLKGNTDRLSTPYDLHETLKDLLDMREIEETKLLEREDLLIKAENLTQFPRGISQFLPLPISRTCQTAEIEEHYCTCHSLTSLSTKEDAVQQGAYFLVYSVNQMISKFSECAFLTLKEILDASTMTSGVDKKGFTAYQLSVKTSPGDAVFEASVIRNNKGSWRVSGTISRINLYGEQSHCVNDKEMKLYCYCTDYLKLKA